MLLDVMSLGVTGKDAEHLLDEIGITVNKNQIPFDTQPANTSSGIRVGTPAVTSRGMGLAEMDAIGELIADAIERRDDPASRAGLSARVADICNRFPVPGSVAATAPVGSPAA
jgi:glycine hydroxymethyltransferase